jgi:aspartate dehydrogenase
VSALLYSKDNPMRVAIAGLGNVGGDVAVNLAAGEIPQIRLTAVCSRDPEKAREFSKSLEPRPKVVPLAELPEHADVIVECAVYDAFAEIARVALEAGKTLVTVSVGALGANLDLIELAEKNGGVIRVSSGALPGLDLIRSAKEANISSAKLISRMRPESVAKEAYIIAKGFDFSTPPPKPVHVFSGTAREASKAFPRHFNVATTLSLAGAGLDDTLIELWVDDGIPGVIHRVVVESDAVGLELVARSWPSSTNKSTAAVVAPSVMATLRSMVSPLQIGN